MLDRVPRLIVGRTTPSLAGLSVEQVDVGDFAVDRPHFALQHLVGGQVEAWRYLVACCLDWFLRIAAPGLAPVIVLNGLHHALNCLCVFLPASQQHCPRVVEGTLDVQRIVEILLDVNLVETGFFVQQKGPVVTPELAMLGYQLRYVLGGYEARNGFSDEYSAGL